jgi:hypothetical protein
MTAVEFRDPRLVDFILTGTNDMAHRSGEQSVDVDNDIDRLLLQRFCDGDTTLLRYSLLSGADFWMITGFDEADITRSASRLGRFLTPTYGKFTHNREDIQRFSSLSTRIRPLAESLQLPGFFRLETKSTHRSAVLEAIRTWIKLDSDRPTVESVAKPSYRELLSKFQRSLATSSWDDAQESLDQITRFRLTTADNVAFLDIRLLAAQERWDDIWNSAHYPEWSKQRIPRQIRTALITAYHHSLLLPLELEDDWSGVLKKFGDTRHRLGRLLETRLQENSLPVVRVFAYLAVQAQDHNLADGLRSTLAPEVLAGISPILGLMPAKQPAPVQTVSPEHEATQLLYLEADLDRARQVIGDLDKSPVRATLLADLAERTRDLVDAEEALDAIDSLQAWERNDLFEAKPYLQRHIRNLKSILGRDSPPAQPLDSWPAWLAGVESSALETALEIGLDVLLEHGDERMWAPSQARQISASVQSIVLNPVLTQNAIVRQGLGTLADQLLLDDQFPRSGHTYVELYEAIYTFGLELGRPNEQESKRLLRYAEAILMNDPERVLGVSGQLEEWFPSPLPRLLDTRLDALELVCDYGLDGRTLVHHVRMWADALLSFTADIEETTLRGWAEFAEMIEAGADIVSRLREHKAIAGGTFADAVVRLPDRFRIAIFTLRPKSAERVRALLLAMNPKLDVQISEEKDLSPRVKQLAASADMPVVVTTCITHALTYGIGPHLNAEPVRPDSSGSSSILRAIEPRILTSG